MDKFLIILSFLLASIIYSADAQTTNRDRDRDRDRDRITDRSLIENTFGIGPKIGYYDAGDFDDGNFYYGLMARLRLGPVIGIEGTVEYRPGQELGLEDYTVETNIIPVTASLLLFLPIAEGFTPYGIAGAGAYFTDVSFSNQVEDLGLEGFDETNFGYHLGFGVEFPFSRNVALTADYRYLWLNADEDEILDGASYDGNVISVGLMFYF